MGEAKRKAQIASKIAVLIPERGRPDKLDRLICSLIDMAGDDDRYEIIAFIDDDDPEWTDKVPFEHSHTTYLRRPRPITLGEKLNELARYAVDENGPVKADIVVFLANDLVMETQGWPGKMRSACAGLPNGIGVPFLTDDLHPGHASYWLMTRKMMHAIGFFAAPWFPYWFIDTWMNELGILLGQHHQIPVRVSSPEGRSKTHGLVDLPFWIDFFQKTRALRIRDAVNLAVEAFGENSAGANAVQAAIGQRNAAVVKLSEHLSHPFFAKQWASTAASEPAPRYQEARGYAGKMLAKLEEATPRRPRVVVAVPSGRSWEAASGNAVAALTGYSALAGIEIQNLNTQASSIAHNRNQTVGIALQTGADYVMWIDSDMVFPPDALVRLMKHEKDIVGATYCKRTYPHEVLGRFVGPRPETPHDGLHEASHLPGGMMLVKTSVYRKMGFPWYAETYKFDGPDRLSAFKMLLRSYFGAEPPAEVIDSLDGSLLGDWIADNYRMGEDGDESPYLSEDNFFLRRSRRAGAKVWCDIALTEEMVHLGLAEIQCRMPSDIQRAERVSVFPRTTVGSPHHYGEPIFGHKDSFGPAKKGG